MIYGISRSIQEALDAEIKVEREGSKSAQEEASLFNPLSTYNDTSYAIGDIEEEETTTS